MRTPCAICDALVLPITAKSDGGLCGQCARDPLRARKDQARRAQIAAMGAPLVGNIRNQLIRLTETAATEAQQRFAGEGVYAFLLFSDPHLESAVPRAMTDAWAKSMPSGARWGGSGWYEEGYMIREEEFELISQWAQGLPNSSEAGRGEILLPCYMKALRYVASKKILADSAAFLLISDGMGYEEIYAIAETINTESTLAQLRDEWPMDLKVLSAVRTHYHGLI